MKTIATVAFVLVSYTSLYGQAFQNLNFESATVPNLPYNSSEFVSITNGLPSWSAYIGANQLTDVGHNWVTLGNANVAILGPQYLLSLTAIEGSYTAILQPGIYNSEEQSASIAQIGLIPLSANSIQFKASLAYTNDLSVTVGGQNRQVIGLGSGLFGCDVSTFTSSIEEIRFTIGTAHGNTLNFLDAIAFSPTQVIPEPGVQELVFFAFLLLGWSRVNPKGKKQTG